MYLKTDAMGTKINNIQRTTSNKLQEATQRLSTGLRINSAKDDAAGLSISERLKSKANENNQINRNLSDVINMFSTKDGVYGSITDHIQRLRELAIQAQNGTNSSNDKLNIQKEAEQIIDSINNLASKSTFNGLNLIRTGIELDGKKGYVSFPNSPNLQFGSGDFSVSLDFKLNDLSNASNQVSQIISMWGTGTTGFEIQIHNSGAIEFGVKDGTHKNFKAPNAIKLGEFYKIDMVRENGIVSAYINGEKVKGTITTGNSDTTSALTIGREVNGSEYFGGFIGNVTIYNRALTEQDIEKHQMGLNNTDGAVAKWLNNEFTNTQVKDETDNGLNGMAMGGATWGKYSSYLGLSNLDVANSSTINKIDKALEELSKNRSELGAYQSRLEMRKDDVIQSTIHLKQSGSRISDADFSKETSILIKEQIKLQASAQMLQKNNSNREATITLLQS